MTRYATSRVMYDITRDRDLAERFRAEPMTVLADCDLDEAERVALAGQDIRALFELGIHPFVVYHFALRLEGRASLQFMQEYVAKLQGLTLGELET